MIAPPARTKCSAFSAWWSPVANGYGTRIAGLPGRRELEDGAARAREHEVGGGVRGADPVGLRDHAVVRPLRRAAAPTS